MDNRVLLILAIILVAAVAVTCLPSALEQPTQAVAEPEPEPELQEDPVDPLSTQIVINNSQWGEVRVESFNGSEVTFKAVAKEGCHFEYWLNSEGKYIPTNNGNVHSPYITSEQLDRVRTVAVFQEGEGNYSNLISFDWHAPVYYSNGSYGSTPEYFTCILTEKMYNDAQQTDVHRKAVVGNTYVTPWELVRSDEAVDQCVEYLEEKTRGQTDLQKAMTLLWFVQDIVDYRTDRNLYGVSEYWALPLETLYSGYGDCEDTSILFCAIGAKMGLDVGLVGFSYSDAARKDLGHMGAAVALTGNASVENAATFVMDGVTYVYCETATDYRIDLGVLAYNERLNAYRISDGSWTHIMYDSGTGEYSHEMTVTIGQNSNSGEVIYSDDFSEPPTVRLMVGEEFHYEPATSMESAISADGTGMLSEGGFLTFDEKGVLSGKADREGAFTVLLTAYWTNGVIEQTATQLLRFDVQGTADTESASKELRYANGQWTIDEDSDDVQQEAVVSDGQPGKAEYAMLALLAVLVAIIGLMVLRRA